jgi:hypothetical protein
MHRSLIHDARIRVAFGGAKAIFRLRAPKMKKKIQQKQLRVLIMHYLVDISCQNLQPVTAPSMSCLFAKMRRRRAVRWGASAIWWIRRIDDEEDALGQLEGAAPAAGSSAARQCCTAELQVLEMNSRHRKARGRDRPHVLVLLQALENCGFAPGADPRHQDWRSRQRKARLKTNYTFKKPRPFVITL